MAAKLLIRDLVLVGLMLALVAAALGHQGGGLGHVLLSVIAAVFVGLCGHLVHEYGHLAGSLLTRSRVRFPTALTAPLVFDFDVAANSRAQFLAMSAGGYLGSVVGVALIAALLPLDQLVGQLSLALALLGLIVSAVLEGPTTWRVARGGEPPPALLTVAK